MAVTTVSAMAVTVLVTTVILSAMAVPASVMAVLLTHRLLFLVLPAVPHPSPPHPPWHNLSPQVYSPLPKHPALCHPSLKVLTPVGPPLYLLQLPPLSLKTVWTVWPLVVLPWLWILQTLPHLSQHHALLIQRFLTYVLPIFYPTLRHCALQSHPRPHPPPPLRQSSRQASQGVVFWRSVPALLIFSLGTSVTWWPR